MHPSIFREYDIRGKVGSELLLEEVGALGNALAYYFLQKNPAVRTVILARDGRLSSPYMQDQLATAFAQSGLNVLCIGVCPTPALYYAMQRGIGDAGVMVTASHNPKEYNGLKVMLGTHAVWAEALQEVARFYHEGKKITASVYGSIQEYPFLQQYNAMLVEHFPSLKHMAIPMVIDCGNGTAGTVIPYLVQEFGWQHATVLYADIDGTYPHHEADPVVAENMQSVKECLMQSNGVLGIGFDGDADRMAAMTQQGYLVPGDQLLAVFAQQIVQKNPGAAVVVDVKVSSAILELLQQWHAQPVMSPAGHAYIKQYMQHSKAVLAGELSCHFFFHDRYFGYDDGIYAFLRLLECLQTTKTSLDQLLAVVPARISTREIRLACHEEKKREVITFLRNYFAAQPQAQLITLDGIRVTMPYGWGLVRVSNTQPVLSMRFESDSAKGLQKIEQDFIVGLSNYFPRDVVERELLKARQ